MKLGTLFTGIGGVDVGAKAASLDLAWGIEIDQKAAATVWKNI